MASQTYITSLSIEECRQRLREHSYSSLHDFFGFTFWARTERGTVFAKVSGDRFRLFAEGPECMRNSFAPFLYGSLESLPTGTRIHGRFHMHPSTRIFMAIWFGLLALITLVLIASSFLGDREVKQPLHVIFGSPLIMAFFGTGLVVVGWWFGQGQRQIMRDFIQNELLGQPEVR